MKRINLNNENKNPNFIGSWTHENDKFCDDIVSFFEENKDLHQKGGSSAGVNEAIKKSTDIVIYPNDLKNEKYKIFVDYFLRLNECFNDFKEQYPFLKSFIKKIHIGKFNIQKYSSGDHFGKLHCERADLTSVHRIFAWMTYLNDVEDGGTTDFEYFNLKIKPEKGKTLIWPAEWTHAHSGAILKSGKKYIITGWLQFTD